MKATVWRVRPALWGFGDQALSSITNFLLTFSIARDVGLVELGGFTLVFTTYTIALGLSRALTSEPQLIRYSTATTSEWHVAAAAASGLSLLTGIVTGAALAVLGVFITGDIGLLLIWFGLFMPALLLQDNWRYAFFSLQRGSSALANDAIWTGVMLCGILGPYFIEGPVDLHSVVITWGVGATLAAAIGICQAGVWPNPLLAIRWLKAHRDIAPKYALELLARVIGSQMYVYAIGVVSGVQTLGLLRAGYLLFSPIQVAVLGCGLFCIPQGAQILLRRNGIKLLFVMVLLLSTSLAGVAVVWAGMLSLLPQSLGMRILGASWEPGISIVVPVAIAWAAVGFWSGAAIGIRILAAANRSLFVSIVDSTLGLAFGVSGTVLAGGKGAAWGMAISACVSAPIWWHQFVAALRRKATGADRSMA